MQHFNSEKRKLKVIKLGIAALLSITFSTLSAQESINTSGGNAKGSGGSVSYSVGQVTYQTHTGTNGSVAQGVQQPYEISIVTNLEEAKVIKLSVSAYPNPATDYLTLSIDEFDISNFSYQLYDIKGRTLKNEKITGNQTVIVMRYLVPEIYFVKVNRGNKEVITFKIIKN